jgi:hypothetical protein
MAGADAATIREWVSKAEADVATLTAQAEDIQRRLAQSRIQLGLMYELLASLGDEAVSPRADLIGAERSVRERVVHSAVQVLQDRGAPMRIQDIHAEFLRRQLPAEHPQISQRSSLTEVFLLGLAAGCSA